MGQGQNAFEFQEEKEEPIITVLKPETETQQEIPAKTTDKSHTIVFHAKPSKVKKDPTHTLSFETMDNMLLCTYARPHPGLESYSKADGRFYVEKRMAALKEEMKGAIINKDPSTVYVSKQLRILPNKVRSTMGYYANCARRYFKLAENPVVVIRSQYANWCQWMKAGKSGRVPVQSVILSAKLNQL